ncbi:hypothetical protein Tco_1317160 [Tanacetum coccineum]
MSTSKTYKQSLAESGSETRPPILERGSYIPWASRFKRFLNRKRENQKWLLKALEDGPYVFRNITPTGSIIPRLQEVEDLQGDDLLYYDAEMELTNMILLSIPNEIYNSVDSCKTAKEMWDRVERLMRGTIQNQVDRETRAKKVEKYLMIMLALKAHTGSSSKNTSSYYVTHPPSVVDYDEEFEQDDVHNHSDRSPLASAISEIKDEAGGILTDEQNDFLFVDASRMEDIEELSANICLMARIQPADQNSDDEPSYESCIVSDEQSSIHQ